MSITRRTDYAVRLMYELAQLPPGATLSSRDLCEVAEVPENFGASLVPFLIDAGLVRAGGYNSHLLSLAMPAGQISMAQIVRACEPGFSLSQCAREPDSCNRSSHCGVHVMWSEIDALLWRHLETTSLAHVAQGQPHVPSLETPTVPAPAPTIRWQPAP